MDNNILKQAVAAAIGGVSLLLTSGPAATEPANILWGPLHLTPTLETRVSYVDNLLRSHTEELDTWRSEIRPKLQAWIQEGPDTYALTYQLSDYRYSSSSEDDFSDHELQLDVHHEFNVRNTINLLGEYYDGHEARGTDLSDGFGGLLDAPVEYARSTYGGDYTHGTRQSRGRLVLKALSDSWDYGNYPQLTRYRDRDRHLLSGTFFWKIGGHTDALAELRAIDNRYRRDDPLDPSGTLDSAEFNYLLGASWEATAKTTGSVKLGWYDRRYDSSARPDEDGFQWEVDLLYQPRTYSRFNLESRRYTRETNGPGNGIDTQVYKVSWNHDWSSRYSSALTLSLSDQAFTATRRDEEIFDLEASVSFAARRWLDLGVGLRREDRDSNEDIYQYTQDVIFISAELSL